MKICILLMAAMLCMSAPSMSAKVPDPTIELQPTNLRAQVTGHSVVLTWTQPTQPAGETIASTNIFRNGAKIGSVAPTVLTYTDTTVAAGQTYSYALTNVDSVLVESVLSTAVSATIPATTSAPMIVTQPANQTVVTGSNVTFTVVASGTPPLSYQWRTAGNLISGATSSSFSLSSVVTSNSGTTYSVTVSNSAGSVTSAQAILTVTAVVGLPKVGDTIKVNGSPTTNAANIRSTAVANGYGPLLGTQPGGATGVVMLTPVTGPGFYWVNVKFPNTTGTPLGVSGYMGSDNLTVQNPIVGISINPTTATVEVGKTTTFAATVTGSTNTAVTWSTNAPAGVFTAPATPGTATVTATSVADSTKKATATVTITAPPVTLDCVKVVSALGGGVTGQSVVVAVQGGPSCTVTLP